MIDRSYRLLTSRYFILDGYQLYEFESSNVARARHVVDLRGSSAHVPVDGGETRANPVGDRIFEFRVSGCLHLLCHRIDDSLVFVLLEFGESCECQ